MANEIKWIKLSVDILNDEKIIAIEGMPEGSTLCWMWIKMLALCGQQNADGKLSLTDEIPYTEAQLANRFGVPLSTLQMGLAIFERYGMIKIIDDMIYTVNWAKYQSVDGMEKIREQNRIRKQNQREKEKQEAIASAEAQKALPAGKTQGELIQERFDRFWKIYPKKVGKGAALKSFKKIKPGEELTQKMIGAVEAQKKSAMWLRNNGQYIPNPSTWLNQGRWEDELPQENRYQQEQDDLRDRGLENWDDV